MILLLLICLLGVEGLVDNHATKETKNLYNRLKHIASDESKVLFGMQEATLQGLEGGHKPYILNRQHGGFEGWIYGDYMVDQSYPDELCDVKRLTGAYPAVIGFDLYDLKDYQSKTTTYLGRRAYERGEVVTVVMHHTNPVTGGSPWVKKDKGNYHKTVKRLLPGGDSHWKWTQILDKVAEWAHGFKDSKGTPIPVIFRFLHELNGDWFYWGLNNGADNTEAELKSFFRFTVEYLRDKKGVHQFLYAYSPDKFKDEADYLKTYPGDDYVDILGTDFYYNGDWDKKETLQRIIRNVVHLAESRNKIPALTETGYSGNKIDHLPDFWTTYVLDVIKREAGTKRIAFVHAWTNQCFGDDQYLAWVPYKGHPGASGFVNTFYKDPLTVFGDKIPNFYH